MKETSPAYLCHSKVDAQSSSTPLPFPGSRAHALKTEEEDTDLVDKALINHPHRNNICVNSTLGLS
jgi:hypothetical protein